MTEISYFFKTRVKGSVTPLIYGRDAKDLRDSEDSTKLKNIPTSSSGDKFAHSLGNTTFFLHTFIINLHGPFFFILTHLYSYFVIHFYPLKTVDQTVESLYFLNIFSQRSSLNF